MKIHGHGETDVGQVREKNEDSFLVDEEHQLYIVADGMGGHLGGSVASSLAVESYQNFVAATYEHLRGDASAQPSFSSLVPRLLTEGMRATCYRVFSKAQDDSELAGMGTTLTCLWFGAGRAFVAHVGDSRCYLYRQGKLQQLTEDHSLVNEHVQAGLMTEEEAKVSPYRNMITRSIGFEPDVAVDVLILPVQTGDRFLLCSDGLSNHLELEDLAPIFDTGDSLEELGRRMIDGANERGGDDNITAVLAEVVDFDVADYPASNDDFRRGLANDLLSPGTSSGPVFMVAEETDPGRLDASGKVDLADGADGADEADEADGDGSAEDEPPEDPGKS